MEYPRGKRVKVGVIDCGSNLNIKELINDICPCCFGSGKQKTMQMAATYDSGSVRVNDTSVKCEYCNGKGFKSK